MTSNDYHIRDAGDPRRYYTMIPNMVDDMGLSVYAFRLYVHLKRVAGDGGKCWQSTRTLATECNMSTATVSRAKIELSEKKLIEITKKPGEHGGLAYHEITIVDVWATNSQTYQVTTSNAQVTVGNMQVSPEKHASYSSSIKEEPTKKQPIKKERKITAEKTPAEILTPVVDALALVTRMDARLNYGRIAKEAKMLITAGYTAEQISGLYGEDGKWYSHDWRGKKGQPPTLAQVRETIGVLPSMNGNGNGNGKKPPAQDAHAKAMEFLDKLEKGEVKL